jgi:hypothetical protein
MVSVNASDDSNRSVPLTIVDIGSGGVGPVTKSDLVIGDVFVTSLSLVGAIRGIYIQARVLWTQEYGRVGCEFIPFPPGRYGLGDVGYSGLELCGRMRREFPGF